MHRVFVCSEKIAFVFSCQDAEINQLKKADSSYFMYHHKRCMFWFNAFEQSQTGKCFIQIFVELVEKYTCSALEQNLILSKVVVCWGFFWEESKGKISWDGEIWRLNKDMNLAFWLEYECVDCHTCFFYFHWKFLDVRDLCWWTFLLKLVKLLVKRFCEQKSVLFSLPALAQIVSWTCTNCCYFEGCQWCFKSL